MRKGLALILTGAMVMSLAACGGGGSSTATTQAAAATTAAGSSAAAETTAAPAAGATTAAQTTAAAAADGKKTEIAVCVPSADHGWTGAVLTYAQEEADKLNADTAVNAKYSVKVYAATDVENQIQQVDDLLANKATLAGIVILPYDNGLQSELEKIVSADVPLVQFDRVINSDTIDAKVISNVKGDNEGIGYATAERFIADGLTKDDYVYEMIGDNSSVPELRSAGFRKYLTEQGWTDDDINKVVVKSAATGWSRDKGKELFESWFGSAQCDPTKNNWIFTHDDEIAMGIMESLNGSALDANKKTEFLKTFKGLGASSGLAEIYAVIKDKHQTITRPETYDLFSVTYDPAMIKDAVEVMVDYLDGKTTGIEKLHIIPVSVVDKDNVGDFQAFGTYDEKK